MRSKEAHRKYNLQYYHDRKNKFIQQLGGKCARCGSTDNLEFDHVDSSAKELDISKHISHNMDVLQHELQKCQLLCRSCHIKKTKEEKDSNAKISEDEAMNIRREYASSGISQEKLGKKYGLKQSEIGNILRGTRWSIRGENSNIQAKIDEKRKANNYSIAVDMLDPDTNRIVKTYNNMKSAKQDGFKDNHIAECCRGKAKTHGGYKWQFHNKEQN